MAVDSNGEIRRLEEGIFVRGNYESLAEDVQENEEILVLDVVAKTEETNVAKRTTPVILEIRNAI